MGHRLNGMVQCTADISEHDCSYFLSHGIAKISSCCNMKWVVMCSPTCMVAYTPWRFYDSVDTTNEPSSCLLPRGMRREVSHKRIEKEVYQKL